MTKNELDQEITNGLRKSVTCRARNRTDGKPCTRLADPWCYVCRVHGARTPQSLASANERRSRAYLQWRQLSDKERQAWSEPFFPEPDEKVRKIQHHWGSKEQQEEESRQLAAVTTQETVYAYERVKPATVNLHNWGIPARFRDQQPWPNVVVNRAD